MNELTPAVFIEIWTATKADKPVQDPDLARFQKFMLLHEDLHPLWNRLVQDPATPLDVEGENMMLHVAMDAATEAALESGQPDGLRGLFQALTTSGLDAGRAFHVLSQAMMHEFVTAAEKGEEMTLDLFLNRATTYTGEAIRQAKGEAEEAPPPSP